jgi:hypothetical protein
MFFLTPNLATFSSKFFKIKIASKYQKTKTGKIDLSLLIMRVCARFLFFDGMVLLFLISSSSSFVIMIDCPTPTTKRKSLSNSTKTEATK